MANDDFRRGVTLTVSLIYLRNRIHSATSKRKYMSQELEKRQWPSELLLRYGISQEAVQSSREELNDRIYGGGKIRDHWRPYLQTLQEIVTILDSANAIPLRMRDKTKVETSKFLVRFESDQEPTNWRTYNQRLLEWSAELDKLHRHIFELAGTSFCPIETDGWSAWKPKSEIARDLKIYSWKTIKRGQSDPTFPVEIEMHPHNAQLARYRFRNLVK